MKGPKLNENQIRALFKKNTHLEKDLNEIVSYIGKQAGRLETERADELREMILRAFTRVS